jgi:hypothetical protein
MRALPSDSTTHTEPVSAARKFAPLKPTGTRRKFLAEEPPRRLRQVLRRVAEFGEAHLLEEQRTDLVPVAMKRRHHDVRRPILAELDDEVREIGFVRRDARGFQRLVQSRLIRGPWS